MELKLVISEKTGKSYQKNIEDETLIGKKIGEKVDGSIVGLEGYELEITGGSDKAGFPMRKDLEGAIQKKIVIVKGVGLRKKHNKGVRTVKTVKGNTISHNTSQINLKVIKAGAKPIEEVLGKKEEKPAEEPKKEEAPKEQPKESKPEVKPEQSGEKK